MSKLYLEHKELFRAVILLFAFVIAAGVAFSILVKPYAVYADGTKVTDPCIISADGRELIIVEDEETAAKVIKDVMKNYMPENGDLNSIKTEEELKIEDKTLFVGVTPPRVLTEEEAVDKVLASNETDTPMMHVETVSNVDSTEAVEPETTYEKTDQLFEGNKELKTEGTEGEKIVTNEVVMVNGDEASSEKVDEEIINAPEDKIYYLGTAARPADTAWEDYSGQVLASDDGSKMTEYGLKFVGNPYKWGGTSLTNGTDCSGFIYSVYRHFGYDVPRMGFYKMGKGVCLAEAKAGDVVYYPGHYAMYMGDGKIVHAYNSRAGICVSNVHAPGRILTIRRFVEEEQ